MIGSLLEKLFVSVAVDMDGFTEELDRASGEVKKMAGKAKRDFQSIGAAWQQTGKSMMRSGAMMSAGITAPLTIAAKGAFDAAVNASEAMGQVEAAIKSMGPVAGFTADQLADMASGLQAASTFDDDDILKEVTANMLTFGNVQGKVFSDAQALAVDLSTRLGTDLKSSTIMLGKALNDPVKGLTALSRVGVSFTKEQEAMIKGMAAAGDVAGAQALMVEELKKQYGGAGQAARDAAPGSDTIDAWREAEETIGKLIMDVLPPLADALTSILGGFNNLSPGVQAFIVGFAGVAAIFGPVLLGVGALVTGIGALIPILAGAVPVIAAIGAAFTTLMLSPLGLVVAAVAAVVAAFVYWDEIKEVAASTGKAISDWYGRSVKPSIDGALSVLRPFVDFFKNIFAMSIGDAIRTAVVAFANLHINAIKSLTALASGVKTWLQDKLMSVFSWLGGKLEEVGGYFYDLYDKVVGNSYVPDMVERIGEEMGKLQSLMVDPAARATKSVEDAFRALADRTEGLLGRLFPLQAQIRAIMEDLGTLDEALAAGQISQATYDQGREILRDELAATKSKARGPVEVSSGVLNAPSLAEGMEILEIGLIKIPPMLSQAGEALYDFGVSIGGNIMNALHGVIEGEDFFDTLKNGFFSTLKNAMHRALSDLEGAIFGEGGFGGFLGGLFTNILSGGARATGGPIVPGRAYDVGMGEKFVAGAHGRILSRSDAMKAMGGGGGPSHLTVKVEGARGNAEIMDMVMAGVEQGIGQYDRVVADRVDDGFKRRAG